MCCNFVVLKSVLLRYLVCCKMEKELLGSVVFSIKINVLTRSQIATANVLLNEI